MKSFYRLPFLGICFIATVQAENISKHEVIINPHDKIKPLTLDLDSSSSLTDENNINSIKSINPHNISSKSNSIIKINLSNTGNSSNEKTNGTARLDIENKVISNDRASNNSGHYKIKDIFVKKFPSLEVSKKNLTNSKIKMSIKGLEKLDKNQLESTSSFFNENHELFKINSFSDLQLSKVSTFLNRSIHTYVRHKDGFSIPNEYINVEFISNNLYSIEILINENLSLPVDRPSSKNTTDRYKPLISNNKNPKTIRKEAIKNLNNLYTPINENEHWDLGKMRKVLYLGNPNYQFYPVLYKSNKQTCKLTLTINATNFNDVEYGISEFWNETSEAKLNGCNFSESK